MHLQVDGLEHLLDPLTKLFKLIYNTKQIPQQWLVSKITPIFKKGPKQNIENYRPIANLWSTYYLIVQVFANTFKDRK